MSAATDMTDVTTDPTAPGDPGTPPKKSIVLTLAQQANDAIAGGADPKRVSDRLGMMVQHIQSNPHLLLEADDALNKGADPDALGNRIYHLSLVGKAERDNAAELGAQKDDQNVVQGAARAAFHGATLGFGDELTAGARALFDKGPDAYNTELQGARTDLSNFRDTHPKTAIASELGGGLVPATLLPGARALDAIKGGAAYGAIQGAGDADGGLSDRLTGAAVGAGAGAAGGAFLSKVAAPIGRVAFDATKAAAKPLLESEAMQSLTDWLAAHPAGLSTVNVGPPGSAPPPNASRGIAGTAERIVSDLGPRSADDRAKALLLEKIAADKGDLPAMAAAAQASGKPNAIADLAGENTLGLQRAARTVPGEGKTAIPAALYDRQGGHTSRLVDDLIETSRSPGRINIPKAIADKGAEREAAAEQMYGQLRQLPPAVIDGASDLFNRPAFRSAIGKAQTIAANGGQDFPKLFDQVFAPSTEDAIGVVDAMGQPAQVGGKMQQVARPIDFQTADRVKRALDDMLTLGKRSPLEAGGIGPEEEAVIRGAKNQYLTAADKAFPGYENARDVFAGHSAMMNAFNDGRNFLAMHPQEAEIAIQGLGQHEKEAFLQGATESVAQDLEKGMGTFDKTRRVILPQDKQQRLRLLFPDDQSFQTFLARANEEARMRHSLNFTVGGSNTTDKAAEIADLSGGSNPWLDMMTRRGVVPGTLAALGQSATRARLSGVTTETANALTPMFTAGMGGNKQELADLIQNLIDFQARDASRKATRAAASRPFTASAGGFAGSVASPPNSQR